MSYSYITFKDKNPIKRWLQNQRLLSAIRLAHNSNKNQQVICDFGAGNGELCKLLGKIYPDAKIICYEPTLSLLNEARENLKGIEHVIFCQDSNSIALESIDLLFCLEVFEHLPPKETDDALDLISRILSSEGRLVVGIPVEIGVPALYKGIFRMSRRFGAFDATFKNVLLSFIGFPPNVRPTSEISPGLNFYIEHMGFNFHRFKEKFGARFKILKISASPFPFFTYWLMPEVYFTAIKANASFRPTPLGGADEIQRS